MEASLFQDGCHFTSRLCDRRWNFDDPHLFPFAVPITEIKGHPESRNVKLNQNPGVIVPAPKTYRAMYKGAIITPMDRPPMVHMINCVSPAPLRVPEKMRFMASKKQKTATKGCGTYVRL